MSEELIAKAYAFRSGDLDIFIFTENRGSLALVVILGLYLVFMTLGFAIFVRANEVKEQEIRSEMSMQQLRLENEFNERIANISRSVAHDIRSLLSVLNIIGDNIKTDFPEDERLLGEVSNSSPSLPACHYLCLSEICCNGIHYSREHEAWRCTMIYSIIPSGFGIQIKSKSGIQLYFIRLS